MLIRILVSFLFILVSPGSFAEEPISLPKRFPDIKKLDTTGMISPEKTLEMKKSNPKGVAFFDIRTRAEAMYVGMPEDADALVPYMEHQEWMVDWDDEAHMYKLEQNPDFIPEIERRMALMGLTKTDPIVLLCRYGMRGARAAIRLRNLGYTQVFFVENGSDGWKKSKLSLTTELQKEKMYFRK